MASHGAGTNQVQASSSQPQTQTQAQPSANMKGKILTKNSFASQSLSDDHNSDESVAEEQYVQPPVAAKRFCISLFSYSIVQDFNCKTPKQTCSRGPNLKGSCIEGDDH